MFNKNTPGTLQKIWLVTFIILAISVRTLLAQNPYYTPQSILQDAIRAVENNTAQDQMQTDVDLPTRQTIDQIEFRTEFNELDLEQTEYTLRVGFRNDKIRRLRNQLYQMRLNFLENDYRYSVEDSAESLYKNIVALHYLGVKDSLYLQNTSLLEDKNNLEMELFQNDDRLNFNDILKINERNKNVQLLLFDARQSKSEILQSLLIEENNALFDKANWITISSIKEVINGLKNKLINHPSLGLQADRINLLNQEYLLEENDKDNILDFVQLKYKIDDKEPIQKELSLGVAILIPYKRTNTANLAKIEIEKIEENYKQREIINELNSELDDEAKELISLIERYEFFLQFIEDENLQSLKEKYLASEQVSPIPLVNLELMLTERRLDLISLEKDIYMQYISTLANTGLLRLSTNTNYLDDGLAPIE